MKKRIIIIGGGAAGFFAAITCAESNPQLEVIILERGKEVLGKVKISGGGRCNVTHACFVPRELIKFYPRGARELLGPFNRFCTGDMLDWLDQRGVATKIENDNRIFPESNSSQTIMDCLQQGAKQAGVKVLTRHKVEQLHSPPTPTDSWKITTNRGDFWADRLMIASGSNPRVWEMLKNLGHSIIPPVPSLFTFNIKDERIKNLPGLSVPQAQVKILGTKLQDAGPLLITHWGLSGPAILKLSAWGARDLHELNYQFDLQVNWLGFNSLEDTRLQLADCKKEWARKLIPKQNPFQLPNRLWHSLTSAAGINDTLRWADANKKALNRLAVQLTQCIFKVNGKSTFKEEFVTAGGLKLKEINFKTFGSKILPNLFFAGEVLNIDAVTGGFNFQAAWTGGYMAGNAMAEE
ncbi:MAG: NAD(P)/FAD-dependent oxidoreductase [Saprospiraceae bacterium]